MVSIIIPVYNTEKYIRKCFDSILAQTFTDYEVIVVDDGSTDGSPAIISEYLQKYPKIFKSFRKENGGQSAARNFALQYASGDYYTFLDSDDYIAPDYLATLCEAASSANSDVVISGQLKVGEDGSERFRIAYAPDKNGKIVMRRLNFAGKLYRSGFLKEHFSGFAEGKTYEDNPFNLVMLFLAKNPTILPYVGYYQSVHEGSTTATKIDESRIPYDEIEAALSYMNERKEEINDYSIYEFTALSFFTYFAFEANRKHHYMNVNDRKSNADVILNVCGYVRDMTLKYFPDYLKNPHVGIFNNNGLELKQRAGTWLFTRLVKTNMIIKFACMYYRLGGEDKAYHEEKRSSFTEL